MDSQLFSKPKVISVLFFTSPAPSLLDIGFLRNQTLLRVPALLAFKSHVLSELASVETQRRFDVVLMGGGVHWRC